MFKSISLITAVVFGLASSTAFAKAPVGNMPFAAEIVAAEGKVLLNRGEGFIAAPVRTPLAVGDQVMVGSESSATVVYAAVGCTLTVNAGSLVRIAAEAPCKSGENIAMANQTIVSPAAFVNVFGGSNENARLLALIPLAAVAALVLVVASTYKEPGPASAP